MKDTPGHDGWTWRLVTMTLVPCGNDHWYWRMNYVSRPNSGSISGLPPFLCLVVLMDGTLVEPKVYDRKKPEDDVGEEDNQDEVAPTIPTELRGHGK